MTTSITQGRRGRLMPSHGGIYRANGKPKRSLTTHQVADFCGCHFTSVIRWITQGKLKAYRTVGGHRRVVAADLIGFMQRFEIPIPAELEIYRTGQKAAQR